MLPLPASLEALPLPVAVVSGPGGEFLAANGAWRAEPTLLGAASLAALFPAVAAELAAGGALPLRFSRLSSAVGGWWDLDLVPNPELPESWLVTARDATEAVRLQRAADRAARLQLAIDSGRIGAWEIDLVTGRGSLSPGCRDLLGMEHQDFTGKAWLLALHPDDHARAEAAWAEAVEQGTPYELECRTAAPAADGGARWLLIRGAVERDEDGHPLRGAGVLLDITSRRRAEEALQESEARLRFAQRIGRLGGFEIDLHTGLNLRSAEYMALQGRGASPAEEYHADWVGRLHPEDRERAEAHFLAAVQGDATEYAQEYRVLTPQNEVRWIVARGEIERDAEGRALRMRGAHLDVTEMKQAEARLAESEARLRLALSVAALGVVEWDLETGVTIADARAAAISRGLLPPLVPIAIEGPERAAWRAAIHPEDLPRRLSVRGLVQGGAPSSQDEYRIRLPGTPEGEWDWIASRSAVVLRDAAGRALRVLDIIQDITPRRRAEAALAESEARFRALVETMPQVAFSLTPEAGVDFVNPRWHEFSGQPAAAAEGVGWMAALHPDDLRRTLITWHQAVAHGRPGEVEHRLRRADGTWRWFLTRVHPLRAPEDGRILRWFGTSTDITEIVAARESAARAREELEARVAERTRALSDVAAELQAEMRRREAAQAALLQSQKLEVLGQLTSGVAHDFNNVLAAIIGSYRLIARRTQDPALLEMMRHGERAAERAGTLVRQLLGFARREELRPRLVQAAEVLHGAMPMLRHTLGARIELQLEAPEDLWPVLTDPAQLEVALLNLAANARDAMPDGGKLRISARNLLPSERPARLRPGDYVGIAVRDTGAGMAEEVLARAAEPFFTTKPAGRGTGLGLAMVQGFAEGCSGCLRLDSRPGEGTTVEIVLPRAAVIGMEPRVDDDGTDVLDPAWHGDAVILMAEDDDQVRPVTATFLRDLGYRVTEAPSAEVAVALAHASPQPDLLLTDVEMPGADGVSLAMRLRSERPSLPVIFVTGRPPGPALADEVVLRKPYTGKALAAAILSALGRRKVTQPVPAE